MLCLTTPVRELRGVGPVAEGELKARGIHTVGDLMLLSPIRWQTEKLYPLSAERVGEFSGFHLTVVSDASLVHAKGRGRFLRYLCSDEDGTRVTLYFFNQIYLKNQIRKGQELFAFGVLQEKKGVFSLFSPKLRKEAPEGVKIRPIYSASHGLSTEKTERLLYLLPDELFDLIPETLPTLTLKRLSLPARGKALLTLHRPQSEEALQLAKKRFSFEALFRFCVQARLFHRQSTKETVQGLIPKRPLDEFFASLPFRLTGAQRRAISEIERDMSSEGRIPPMHRLLQGDVGSGKTAVAAAAAYLCAMGGKSTLVMAPTEILATQHANSFARFFEPFDIPVLLLTGSTPKRARDEIFRITQGNAPYILVGTHALVEEGTVCHGVGLAVCDEQHRFGVRHRNLLGDKNDGVHTLVMSATPIPRSLAMFLYTGENISVLDELPPGRQAVDTFYIGQEKLVGLYDFIRQRGEAGEKAFIVCPLIEDEEDESPLQSAVEEWEQVKKAIPSLSVGLLHGKMKSEEKETALSHLIEGKTQVLVSTTVIEVGVDVPRATVMVIQNAERFGLSQLHQLRGRVGRGKDKAWCFLVSSHPAKSARERLKKLCDCHDGFELARFDLEHRGPGDFFGTRQSGFDAALSVGMDMEEMTSVSHEAELFLNEASPEELIPYEKATRLN